MPPGAPVQVSVYTTQQEPCQPFRTRVPSSPCRYWRLARRQGLLRPAPSPADRMQGVRVLQSLPHRLSQSERDLS
jgi:hypothetical protein